MKKKITPELIDNIYNPMYIEKWLGLEVKPLDPSGLIPYIETKDWDNIYDWLEKNRTYPIRTIYDGDSNLYLHANHGEWSWEFWYISDHYDGYQNRTHGMGYLKTEKRPKGITLQEAREVYQDYLEGVMSEASKKLAYEKGKD